MKLRRWKRLRRVFEVRNPWWSYRKDDIEREDGMRGEYHAVHSRGSSMVVPVDERGRVILVNQYRYLNDRESLEFPCGSLKEGQDHRTAAELELAEETGRRAAELVAAGEHNPCNGITDEICRVYVARGLSPADAPPDPTEEFELVAVAPAELDALIASGRVWDGMTLAAWTLARGKLDGKEGGAR